MRNYKIVYTEIKLNINGVNPYSETWHASDKANNKGTIFAIPIDAKMCGV